MARPDRQALNKTHGSVSGPDQALVATNDVLLKTLRALGRAGRPDEASRLAASAWSVLRHENPREAERVNGLMHWLARLPAEEGAPPIGSSESTRS